MHGLYCTVTFCHWMEKTATVIHLPTCFDTHDHNMVLFFILFQITKWRRCKWSMVNHKMYLYKRATSKVKLQLVLVFAINYTVSAQHYTTVVFRTLIKFIILIAPHYSTSVQDAKQGRRVKQSVRRKKCSTATV